MGAVVKAVLNASKAFFWSSPHSKRTFLRVSLVKGSTNFEKFGIKYLYHIPIPCNRRNSFIFFRTGYSIIARTFSGSGYKPSVYGSVQQKRATKRAGCLFRIKGALFNSLIIVCCVFEKKTKHLYRLLFSCSFQRCHCFYCETLYSGRKLELNIESHFPQSISCFFSK